MNGFYFVVIAGVALSALSQVLLKKSAAGQHRARIFELLNVKVIVAYIVFFVVIVANIYALKNGVNVKDMPILESLGYLFIPLFSYIFLQEKYKWRDVASLGLIIIGIIVFYA